MPLLSLPFGYAVNHGKIILMNQRENFEVQGYSEDWDHYTLGENGPMFEMDEGKKIPNGAWAVAKYTRCGKLCDLDDFRENDRDVDCVLRLEVTQPATYDAFYRNHDGSLANFLGVNEETGMGIRESHPSLSGSVGATKAKLTFTWTYSDTGEPVDLNGLWFSRSHMQYGTSHTYVNAENGGTPLANVAVSNDCPPADVYDSRSNSDHIMGSFLVDRCTDGMTKLAGMAYRVASNGNLCDYQGIVVNTNGYNAGFTCRFKDPGHEPVMENVAGNIFNGRFVEGADPSRQEKYDSQVRCGVWYPDTLWWRSASFQLGEGSTLKRGVVVVQNNMEGELAFGKPLNDVAEYELYSARGRYYWSGALDAFMAMGGDGPYGLTAHQQKVGQMVADLCTDTEAGKEARKCIWSSFGHDFDAGLDGINMWWSPMSIIQRRPTKRAVLDGQYALDGADGCVQPGEEYAYEVTQFVPDASTDEVSGPAEHWTSLEFRDDVGRYLIILPEKCHVYAPSGADITETAGKFSFDNDFHRVTYTFNDDYMRALPTNEDDTTGMVYTPNSAYRFWVTVRVKEDAPKTEIHDIAVVEASHNGGSQTNEVVVPVDVPALTISKTVI